MSGEKLLAGSSVEVDGGTDVSESDSDWLSESPVLKERQSQAQSHSRTDEAVGLRRLVTKVKTVLTEKLSSPGGEPSQEYRVYRWRWFMLATLSLLNVSNGTVSSLAPCSM